MIEIIKKVSFDLDKNSGKLSLPDLKSKGYARNYIVALFEELESAGYGEFKRGTQGRGQCHKFIKNEKCPETYSINIQEKLRGRPKKNANIIAESIDFNPMKANNDEISSEIHDEDNSIIVKNIQEIIDTDLKNKVSNLVVTKQQSSNITSDVPIESISENIDEEEIPF